jgi:DNA repair photolyase
MIMERSPAGSSSRPAPRGRGSAENPPNRFERLHYAEDPELEVDADPERVPTQYLRDPSRSLGFAASLNPYRGCEHGCAYCYARPYHEYLGLSAGLDFETRILVKESAPALLRAELSARRWEPQVVALSGATDPYQPVERRLGITRRCLEVLAEFRNPVAVVTKNRLVTRDADLLAALAREGAASATVSVTTLDPELQRCMEPRTSSPQLRLEAIERLARAGVPVNVNVAPVIPGLNDHEIPEILAQAAAAGASSAAWLLLRLPHAVAPLFSAWLERHAPGRRDKVLARIRSVRGGALDDSRFQHRMRGEGFYAEQVAAIFDLARRRAGLAQRTPELRVDAFRRAGGEQLGLFAQEREREATLRR